MAKIKVMHIDDSAVVRQVVQQILESDREIEMLGSAADPIFALTKMQRDWPDVIVLDVEMPRMDGITFLKKIMSERPTPVVMCSSLTDKGAEITMQALAAGAVAVVTKPTLVLRDSLASAIGAELIGGVKSAAAANMRNVVASSRPLTPVAKLSADAILSAQPQSALHKTTEQIIAIGTSTGGTQALESVLTRLPRTAPGIVVVQHMPEKFTAAFAKRLDSLCEMEVKEAENGDRVIPGRVLIAPGGRHMLLRRSGGQYQVEVKMGPPVNRHCPSVDVLFRSVAQSAGNNVLGIIMTGMGDDGARGMKEMLDAGAVTVGQDERSCVVYGMPKEAVRHGGVQKEISLDAIPGAILEFARSRMV
jgi:two-component system, chemotaxis family, protein-glutamate methylesterase/glutaminase